MKTFIQYLTEITQKEAEDFLGLSSNWTQDDLNNAYKHLSLKYHPDKGGDVKDMQKLNAARKLLKKSKSSGKFDWDSLNKEYDMLKQQIQIELENKFHPEDYIAYFKKVFPSNVFTFKVSYPWKNTNNYAGMTFRFQNKRKDKAFEITITAYITDVKRGESQLAMDGVSYPLSIVAYGYSNKKKIKIFSRDWKMTNKHNEVKPETVFPKSKITKKQTRKFSKRDMLSFLNLEVKGENWTTDKNNFYVETKDGKYIRLFRTTLMRVAAWSVYGIYEKNGRSWKQIETVIKTLPETEETADLIKSWNKMTVKQIKKGLDNIQY